MGGKNISTLWENRNERRFFRLKCKPRFARRAVCEARDSVILMSRVWRIVQVFMKSLLVLGSIALMSATLNPLAQAAPLRSEITPVSWILQEGRNIDVDDKRVTLVGKLIRKDNGSDWWFSDTTGSIRLDTGDKELPVGRMLVVTGHIDQARFGVGHLEVEVSHWEYARS
jgi:hypothetical protein